MYTLSASLQNAEAWWLNKASKHLSRPSAGERIAGFNYPLIPTFFKGKKTPHFIPRSRRYESHGGPRRRGRLVSIGYSRCYRFGTALPVKRSVKSSISAAGRFRFLATLTPTFTKCEHNRLRLRNLIASLLTFLLNWLLTRGTLVGFSLRCPYV
jgi:hypothetical protein